jgi:transposase-like protein
MEKTMIPLRKWFYAFRLVAEDKRGCSAVRLQNELSLSYSGAWYLLKRIRKAMGDRDKRNELWGNIEIDEFFIAGDGGAKRRGRGTSQNEVMLAVEVEKFDGKDGKPASKPIHIKAELVDNAKSETIKSFADGNIKPGSVVSSDGLVSYQILEESGFEHVSESACESREESLKWLHRIVSLIKAEINGTFHGVGKKHLNCYLGEFCWRFNRRGLPLFDRILAAACSSAKLSYYAVTG